MRPGTLLALAALAGAAALTGGSNPAGAASGACPAANRPNELALAGGSPQTAQIDRPFAASLQVALANTNGCPLTGQLAGVSVEFDAPSSGAGGTFASSGGTSATVGTNAQGVATAPAFTANDSAGSYTVDAHSRYGSVELELSNTTAGVPSAIAAVGATAQEAATSSLYPQPLQAQLRDANGNPVGGATVTFAVQNGPYGAGATFLTGGVQATATTNGAGIATAPPLQANGSPGRFTATASSRDLATVAGYALDNHAAAVTLTAASGTSQQATTGTRYPQPLSVRFLDPSGLPIEGAPVTFALLPGAGAAAGTFTSGGNQAIVLTDADGEASSPPVAANDTAGPFTATATVPATPVRVGFALRNVPPQLTPVVHSLAATAGSRYRHALAVRVRDLHGHPVPDAPVAFVLAVGDNGAGATFPGGADQATVNSDAHGLATAPPLLADTTAGAFTATAASGGRTLHLTLTNRAAAPATLVAGAASGTSTAVGRRFPVPLAVTVTDANGNPVAGATVAFSAPRHGPSGSFATGRRTVRVKSDRNGVAVAAPFTANRTVGGFVVRAGVRGSSARTAIALVNQPSS